MKAMIDCLEQAGKERFLKAYFENLDPLNQSDVLHTILAEFGWDAEKVDRIIEDTSIAGAVQEEIAHYQQRGVSGVPFFILNNQYGISGAQPTEVFLEALQSLAPIEGNSCDPVTGTCS